MVLHAILHAISTLSSARNTRDAPSGEYRPCVSAMQYIYTYMSIGRAPLNATRCSLPLPETCRARTVSRHCASELSSHEVVARPHGAEAAARAGGGPVSTTAPLQVGTCRGLHRISSTEPCCYVIEFIRINCFCDPA